MTQLRTITDGKKLASGITDQIKIAVANNFTKIKRPPNLSIIVCNQREDSFLFLRNKVRVGNEIGIITQVTNIPLHLYGIGYLESFIEAQNNNPFVDGIILQLPVPQNFMSKTESLLNKINPSKDVDYLTWHSNELAIKDPINYSTCVSKACIHILSSYGESFYNKKVIIISKGRLVGIPMERVARNKGASEVDTYTAKEIKENLFLLKKADIIISAAGIPGLIKAEHLNDNVIGIDVGTSLNANGEVQGDFNFHECAKKCKLITPVPGGVGPLSVAYLMQHVYESWLKKQNS